MLDFVIVSIGIAPSISFVLLAFKIDMVSSWLKEVRKSSIQRIETIRQKVPMNEKWFRYSVLGVGLGSVISTILLSVIWTSSLSTGIKVSVTVSIVILIVIFVVAILIISVLNRLEAGTPSDGAELSD